MWIRLLLTALWIAISCDAQCNDAAGCFPPLGDLTLGRNIITSSQCSDNDQYCFNGDTLACNTTMHSFTSINDDDLDSYWVSAVNDSLVLPVILQIDFEESMIFDSMEMIWESRTPKSMVLERYSELEGIWEPYRFWAENCSFYDLTDTAVTPMPFQTQDAICTSMEISPTPGATVTFNTSSHLPNGTLQNVTDSYRIIAKLRLVIDEINENALFGVCNNFFAVNEWTVTGSCMCNGHASTCAPVDGESIVVNKTYAGCMCEHNTDEIHCEICQTGYNSVPWMAGTETDANECEACQCNGHADDCFYDEIIMSVVCINCTDNTMGHNCSTCSSTFYPDSTLLVIDENYCKACDCNEAGILDDGECSEDGQCNCKINVDVSLSPQCSECAIGFWNLSESNIDGCQICDCGEGTEISNSLQLCDKVNGICQCKPSNVIGDRCDECEDGFYNLQNGCSSMCSCNVIGSSKTSCDAILGDCTCKDNIVGTVCNRPADGYYYKTLDDIIFEAEYAERSSEITLNLPLDGQDTFSGRGYAVLPITGGTITFIAMVPTTSQYLVILRYKTTTKVSDVMISIKSPDATLNFSQSISDIAANYNNLGSFEFVENVQYNITVSKDVSTVEWMVDSIVLMPDVTLNSSYFQSLSMQEQVAIFEDCLPFSLPARRDSFCDQKSFDLSVEFNGEVFACDIPSKVGTANINSTCDPHGGSYICLFEYTGQLCDQCENGYYDYNELSGCKACLECNATGSENVACDVETGECICKSGVEGDTCDRCMTEFFGFSDQGCEACGCSEYALNNTCDDFGTCQCPDTVNSPKCDECTDNFYNLSANGCLACGCDAKGSQSEVCDKNTGQCNCTENAVGLQCNTCLDGYYIALGDNQDFCIPCFCFGHSQTCVGDSNNYALDSIQSDFGDLCNLIGGGDCSDGWLIENKTADIIPDLSDSNGLRYFVYNGDEPRFIAPEKFHGDLRLSYGQQLVLEFVLPDDPTIPSDSMFVRISGSDSTEAVFASFPEPQITMGQFSDVYTYIIPLTEDNWKVGSVDGSISTLRQFFAVLIDVTDLRFTLKFTTDIIENGQVKSINLHYITEITNVSQMATFTVEDCTSTCPEGHLGPFCDECMDGYYRLSGNPVDDCLPCECNNLANTCNITTGVCINCTSNSEGDQCERCQSGYYGDPTTDVECLQCMCPNTYNSHSLTCILNGTCDACDEGYDGDSCQFCANGYFGDAIDGTCEPCECNNNIDPSLGLTCDPDTGRCLNCQNNTFGFNCELCDLGYFGDVEGGQPCQACQCNINGTQPEICEMTSGICFCKENIAEPDCSQCAEGYYGNPSIGEVCLQCPCPLTNNSHSPSCFIDSDDLITCDKCDPQYSGRDCGECSDGFFGDPVNGICNDCECNGNVDPSLGPTCDMELGYCLNCQNHTYGANCELCSNGYYGDPFENIDCQVCSCNTNGTILPEICEMVIGYCFCKENITGKDCTECKAGFYGDPTQRIECLPCPCLSVENPICHLIDDGTAVCDNCGPAYTGTFCEFCSNGYYRDEESGDCLACDCNGNVDVTLGLTCNVTTGECLNCQNNTFGLNCEQCEVGYYGDVLNEQNCRACECNPNGVDKDICNPLTGTCSCLPNAIEADCSKCEPRFWGLSQGLGCISCDCCTNGSSNSSTECDQDTGDCYCLDGIDDSKCCQCSFGYYNFTQNGCQDCNCGELSVSIQCDEIGQCNCSDGAIGFKCDECAFGYIGVAPNCSRCHDCYFLWYVILEDISNNVTFLWERVQEVISFYNGFTVDDIEDTVKSVDETLQRTSMILSSISVDPNLLNNINETLIELNIVYSGLMKEIIDLYQSLLTAENTINEVNEYVISVENNGLMDIDVEELYQNIEAFNTTIKQLEAEANSSYKMLEEYQESIQYMLSVIESLKQDISVAGSDILNARNTSNMAYSLAEMTRSVSTEISSVNTALKLAEKKAIDLEEGIINSNTDIDWLTADFEELNLTLVNLNSQLAVVSSLSESLKISTEVAKQKADASMDAVKILMEAANKALNEAESLVSKIGWAQELTYNASNTLSNSENIAKDIQAIPIPPVDAASGLASAINSTIVPEEQVMDVVTDANESEAKAMEALDTANNTSAIVENLETAVNDIQSDFTITQNALEEAKADQKDVSDDIKIIEHNLNTTNLTLSNISDPNLTESIINSTHDFIIAGEEQLQQLDEDVMDAMYDSNEIKDMVFNENSELQDAIVSVDEIKMNATALLNTTQQNLYTVNQLQDTAKQNNDTANSVALNKLTELLNKYQSKLSEVQKAKQKIASLQSELEEMTDNFSEAAKKYKKCYKTP